MTEHNLPNKDDATWLDCMDGFKDEYKPLSELSPAAQAVLDATGRKPWYRNGDIAAALRAAADHVIPPDADYASNEVLMIALNVRHQFLAIADELEA